jgi:nucleotide-binding universal stress UspA family protein
VIDATHVDGAGPVLFAYDGSEQAKAAIRAAAQQLVPGRDAIVLTVWEPLAAFSIGAPISAASEIEAGLETEARKTAGDGARLARAVGFGARPMVASGLPVWRTLIEAADEHDAGIVVMGSHGRTGISLVLMGSVATAVARHAARPVLIVHPPGDSHAS